MSKPVEADDARYERKLVAERTDAMAVRRLVARHPAVFRVAYPPRRINTMYFDTPLRAAYLDNAEGNARRSKARIRWYGDLFGDLTAPVLEVKGKRGLVGGKDRFDTPPLRIGADTCWATLAPTLAGADPGITYALEGLEAACVVSYDRDYLLSADGRYRLTIDANVTSTAVGRLHPRWHHQVIDRDRVVVEIKYGLADDPEADRVTSWFPFRIARNSKYARALEQLAL